MISAYPTRLSGITVSLKTPSKYPEFFLPSLMLKKKNNFQLVFHFKQTCTVTILHFGEHGIMAHITMMAKPFRSLQLHYPMIQFLIIIPENSDLL